MRSARPRGELVGWFKGEDNTHAKLDTILLILAQVRGKVEKMAGELDGLRAQVAANTTVIGSAIALIQGIKAKLDAAIASGDPAALAALSVELKTQDDALAQAIVVNTPAG